MDCLAELYSIHLELNRIASRRRFMRHRILDIANQLEYVGDCIALATQGHIEEDLDEALDDLMGVIHYKKFMRRECWDVYHRIRAVQNYVYDMDDYWLTHVYGCHKRIVR